MTVPPDRLVSGALGKGRSIAMLKSANPDLALSTGQRVQHCHFFFPTSPVRRYSRRYLVDGVEFSDGNRHHEVTSGAVLRPACLTLR